MVPGGTVKARVRSQSGGGGIFRVRLVGMVWNCLEIGMQFEQLRMMGSGRTREANRRVDGCGGERGQSSGRFSLPALWIFQMF